MKNFEYQKHCRGRCHTAESESETQRPSAGEHPRAIERRPVSNMRLDEV